MDKIEYLPRDNAGNGNILQLSIGRRKMELIEDEFSELLTGSKML